MKKASACLALLFILLSCPLWAAPVAVKPASKVVVYYFHGTYRCKSCTRIEALTRQAVQQGFAAELKQGRLELRVVNVEEPANRHFVQDYGLYTKSVVVAEYQGQRQQRWQNLDQVWSLLGNEPAFKAYVAEAVRAHLKGRP